MEKNSILIITVVIITSVVVVSILINQLNRSCKPVVQVYSACLSIPTGEHTKTPSGICLLGCDQDSDVCYRNCDPKDESCVRKCYQIKAHCYMDCLNTHEIKTIENCGCGI